jgi:uncharacterized protein
VSDQATHAQLQSKPTARIEIVDALRGFAVCAILLMNVELFTASMHDLPGGISQDLRGLDYLADASIYVLLHGKGWAMFTLLFGVSFAMMGNDAKRWLRRALALLLIGAVHALAIWAGDILLTYAVASLLLLAIPFKEARQRAMLGTLFVLVPLTWYTLQGVLALHSAPTLASDPAAMAAAIERQAEIAAYSDGTWFQATAERWHYATSRGAGWFGFVAIVMGMAMIGSGLFQSGVLQAKAGTASLRNKLIVGAGVAGAALTALSLWLDADPQLVGVDVAGRTYLAVTLHTAASPFLGVAMLCGLVALYDALPRARAALRRLEPLGKLALSAYLVQSLVGTFVFYGYGLAQWGHSGRAAQVALCAALIALQILAARWYVERFAYGPIEWLWRWGTNGRRPNFRREPATDCAPKGGHLSESSLNRTAISAVAPQAPLA